MFAIYVCFVRVGIYAHPKGRALMFENELFIGVSVMGLGEQHGVLSYF
jgi:hypothetical protein